MNDYRLESPPILRDFLSYHETIKERIIGVLLEGFKPMDVSDLIA